MIVSDFEIRCRDTPICFRAVEDLNSSEKASVYQVSGSFCNDDTSKFTKVRRREDLAPGLCAPLADK
jgi:hypothetical protein